MRWPQLNKQRAIGPVSLTGPVSYFPIEMTTVKETESHWSCIAQRTSFLFRKWDDDNETKTEPLVLYCSRVQFPFSPVRWPQWNKQRSIGPVLLAGPVSYFRNEMTTMKQAESNWSCVAHGTSFLFPQWGDHNENNREPLVLYCSLDQFPTSPVRWSQWNKQKAIGPVSVTGPVSYYPGVVITMKQTMSNWSCLAHGTSFLFPQWDYHNETKKEPLVLYRSRDQFPISPVRWQQWN